MAVSNNNERNSDVRLCRLRVWPNFKGLGFNLEASPRPPHVIRLVESNSPASAGGLKILDAILEVNQQDVSAADYNKVREAIKAARDANGPIDLLVCEQRILQERKKKNLPINRTSPVVITTPATMPAEYANFPKHQPRTVMIRMGNNDQTFGFEAVNGENDIGAYIQDVFPNTPASATALRKSDRIIEIDDKFVDKDVSKSIFEKLAKIKSKRAVKLYVMDTATYEHYQLNKMSLSSKGKRKSKSEDRLSTIDRPYTNERESPQTPSNPLDDRQQGPPSITSTLRDLPKARTPSVPDLSRQTRPPMNVIPPAISTNSISRSTGQPAILSIQDDIRLCTINRADASDPFGIELNYHKREQFHSLSLTPGRDGGRSNAEAAGIRTDDRLIEINGQNIQKLDHDQVTNLIRSIKYPEALQMLVADVSTYENYRAKNQPIHQRLPNVKIMPSNRVTRQPSPPSPRPSIDRDDRKPNLNTFGRPIDRNTPSPSINALPSITPLINKPQTSTININPPASILQPRNIPIRKDPQSSNGVGFHFRTIVSDTPSTTPYSHLITSVDTNNTSQAPGLRVNDYILSVNDENVEYLNHDQLEDKLRRAPNSETMRLLVADPEVYRAFKSRSNVSEIPIQNNSRRQYHLKRNPDYEGYGFRVRSNFPTPDGGAHQIISVEPYSPADLQGLRAGDYILRVNNQSVENMSPDQFNQLMSSLVRNDQMRDGTLLLEVMDEDTFRHTTTPSTSKYTSTTPVPTMTDEMYPKMRQCHIRPWPTYRDLGFTIAPSTAAGYQVQQLRLDSPAAHTQIRNGDHLIQVNNINVENTDYQYVVQLINDSYRRDGEVSLLVIDDFGYQWYKRNHFRIDPLSQRANITRHVTPEHQAVYTSTDSNVISSTNRQTPVEALMDHRETHLPSTPYQPLPSTMTNSRPPSTGPMTRPYPYTNGYTSPSRDGFNHSVLAPSVTSSLNRPRGTLSRAAVDVVDGKSMLRYCRLNTEPGQTFGFELAQDENRHIIRNIKPDSPAARAGLHNEDRLICVDDQDVTNRSHREVVNMIKSASGYGHVRLTIAPNNIKPLKVNQSQKTKSLPSLNDERMYQGSVNPELQNNSWGPYDATFSGQGQQPSMVKYLSTSRLDQPTIYPYTDRPQSAHAFDSYRPQTYRSTVTANTAYAPTDPWPRKCVLVRDPTFQGCGFRMLEKDNYDTPIVVEVRSNSPAKRSGLTEGDHIIYIDSRNVQALRTFDEMTLLIQRTFEEVGQVTLVVLTGPAYQSLKRKGGYLQPEPFDYQLPFVRELSPRLCQILLYNHEQDFGFTLQRGNPIHIKDVHPGSPAYEYGLRSNDKILEINGRDTVSLASEQIIEIIEASKRRRQLDILVIDTAGYEFSLKHAIPLNSLLPFVQPGERRAMSNRRNQHEAVYL